MSARAAVAAAPLLEAPELDEAVAPDVSSSGSPLLSLAERARHLRALPTPHPSAPRGPFLVVMGALLAAGLLGLLLLNTTLAQGAFVAHDLQAQTAALADQEQALVQQVAAEESPTVLERRAKALGMVPSSTPVFLRLSDGAVLGVPVPAKAAPKPAPKPAPKVAPKAAATVAPKPVAKTATKTATKSPAASATTGGTGR